MNVAVETKYSMETTQIVLVCDDVCGISTGSVSLSKYL